MTARARLAACLLWAAALTAAYYWHASRSHFLPWNRSPGMEAAARP